MFTGLVTAIGRVATARHGEGLTRFEIDAPYDPATIALGASILHSGVCLTVVEVSPGAGGQGARWAVDAVPETLSRTVLGGWREGTEVNLERSLALGDELGGHFVFGHVDGIGRVEAITREGDSHRLTLAPPADIARYFATKGSVAVDGVSLTVAQAHEDGRFDLAIIPHTWEVTTLRNLSVGGQVNLEIDMLARYVARMIGADAPGKA